jgi:hypothetical protein
VFATYTFLSSLIELPGLCHLAMQGKAFEADFVTPNNNTKVIKTARR